ncbi:MAG TPA: glycosyltransferase [bacterium]|nr:glycosyltransferase [bacterium]
MKSIERPRTVKPKTPRVCIIRRAYYPAETHVRRNIEALMQAGYSVDLVCLRKQGEPAFEVIGGARVHRLPLQTRRAGIMMYLVEYLAFFFLALGEVTWLHCRRPFAIVEADSMPDFLIFAGLVPRLTGSKLILYLFENMPEVWAQKKNLPMTHWGIRALGWQERVSCSFAHRVIATHDMARDAFAALGVPASKIATVLNVPDESVFHRYEGVGPLADGVFRLTQHGTITELYGIQVVIEALSLLNPAIKVHYDVIGDGEYRPTLEALARRLNMQDRVTFHGYLAPEPLVKMLQQSAAGVVPMLVEYMSPNKMFELVALGIPVIASDRRTFQQHFGQTEIVYFRTGDAKDLAKVIENAIRHPEDLQARSRRASERYEEYRWANMQKKYLAVYQELEPV